jgi:hypothetical protein
VAGSTFFRTSVLLVALANCEPKTIPAAESRDDVAWLDRNGTPAAIAALGRLADNDAKARAALEGRSAYDVAVFEAAWSALLRGAPWGDAMLREALTDPKRADLAASGMRLGDPHLATFAEALERALVLLATSPRNVDVSAALVSIGPAARAAIDRRLLDAATRGPMCAGMTSIRSTPSAREALINARQEARDDPECVRAVVEVAARDTATLAWLAERAEPGMLVAASSAKAIPCPLLSVIWTRALGARRADTYHALTVPLAGALKRCTLDMDSVVASAILRMPTTRTFVVEAIDPWTDYGGLLPATCAALPLVAAGTDLAATRERAEDAVRHACALHG